MFRAFLQEQLVVLELKPHPKAADASGDSWEHPQELLKLLHASIGGTAF